MTTFRPALLAASLLALGVSIAPAHAQLARTFVSSFGSDANDCNRLTPCRTFQRAHDNTLAAGEITVLDPGGYGSVTITKGISIINDGVGEAGVLVSGGGNGITVNISGAGAVSLRGLTVKGIGFGGGNGIVLSNGLSLTIENCAIRTLTGSGAIGYGIKIEPTGLSDLAILNTIISNNMQWGVSIVPIGAGTVVATLSRVQLLNNNQDGLLIASGVAGATGPINAVAEDSLAARNSLAGFNVASFGPQASLMLIRSVIAHNITGVQVGVGAAATLRVGQSSLTGNQTSWAVSSGAVLQSYGDNNINGNGDGDPAIPTVIAKK